MAQDKDQNTLNVPPLRFPGFTDEWKKVPISNISNILCGYAFEGNIIVESETPKKLLRGVNITEGVIRHSNDVDRFISGEISHKLDKYILQRGDLVIGMDGSKVGRNSAVISIDDAGSYLVQRVCRLRSNPIIISLIFHQVNNPRFHKYVDNVKTSSAIPHISQGDISKYMISLSCSAEENSKIIRLLNCLDERIATQNKIIDNLQSLIKGLREQLLRKWSQDALKVRLGDICKITTGKLDANAMEEDGIFPFFTCAESPYTINSYAFDTEALLISGNGANVGYINYYNGKFNAYQRTYVLDNFTENIQYVRLYLKSYLPQRISLEKSTSNTPYIVMSTLSDMLIALPNKSIRDKIYNIINSLETKLRIEEEVFSHIAQTKNYLLSKLFI